MTPASPKELRDMKGTGEMKNADEVQVVLVARSETISDLVDACARGELPFSGPDSLTAKVYAMGFNTTSLYPAVMAARAALASAGGGK
jgi:hypothetical protein